MYESILVRNLTTVFNVMQILQVKQALHSTWEYILESIPTIAPTIIVGRNLEQLPLWKGTLWYIQERGLINVPNVKKDLLVTKRDLNRHLAVIHSPKKSVRRNNTSTEKPLKCAFCDMKFRYKSQREQHEILHTGVKPFECTQCHKKFAKKSCLTRHLRVHTGEKPYHCPQCDARFAGSTTLNQHIRIHNGEYPYNCPCCEKKFRVATNLMRHVFTHTGKNPHKCPQCDKQFASVTELKKHGVVHSSERPYKCTVCGNSYKRISALNLHKKVHVKEGHSTDESSTVTIVVKAVLWKYRIITQLNRWCTLEENRLWSWSAMQVGYCDTIHVFLEASFSHAKTLQPNGTGGGGEGGWPFPLSIIWQPVSLFGSALWTSQASTPWQGDIPRVTNK